MLYNLVYKKLHYIKITKKLLQFQKKSLFLVILYLRGFHILSLLNRSFALLYQLNIFRICRLILFKNLNRFVYMFQSLVVPLKLTQSRPQIIM